MSHLDLHLHTTYSDGTQSPEALVTEAAARGVTLIAVTDHDEIGGIIPAQAVATGYGVTVISGVEINTEAGREDVHILGYGFPADSELLHTGLQELREGRMTRALKMLERLGALGYRIERDRLLEIAGHGSIGRPHVARALVEAGHVADISEAFDRLIGNRGPAYVARMQFTPEQAINLIHQAGGVAGLAHPGKLGDPVRFIRRLKDAGLDTLEAYHSDHSATTAERMAKWGRQYRLTLTGGTDSHGPHGPRVVAIGSVDIPDNVGDELLSLLRARGCTV